MRFDLVSQINNDLQVKEGAQLPASVACALIKIQNQRFPELDGLRLCYIKVFSQGDMDSKLITPSRIELVLKSHRGTYHFKASTRKNNAWNNNKEVSDVVLNNNDFCLSFTCDTDYKIYDFNINYFYDKDYICFSYDSKNNKNAFEIYVNIANSGDVQYLNGKPTNLIPDIEGDNTATGYTGNDFYIDIDKPFMKERITLYKTNSQLFRNCRYYLNLIADAYHDYYESYMKPKTR